MVELYQSIKKAVEEEYKRAAEKFGETHHSQHEAYAVMLEEYEETVEVLHDVEDFLKLEFWSNVRSDKVLDNRHVARKIYSSAILAACEAVQVAAMAYKTLRGYEGEGD